MAISAISIPVCHFFQSYSSTSNSLIIHSFNKTHFLGYFSSVLSNKTRWLRRDPKRKFSSHAMKGSITDSSTEEEYKILTAICSEYNDIVIIENDRSRILLLDHTHNIHSICYQGQKWTGSYWDEFSALPAIIPEGPIAILGLGGGTAAHLMLDLWPSLRLEGWEIDKILIDKARQHLGLSDLEKQSVAGGVLHVHIGDALSSSVAVPGGFAGIVVDLFSNGKVIPELQKFETWLELKKKLMPSGRIMVNCGGIDIEPDETEAIISLENYEAWTQHSTISAMCKAFPGNLCWKVVSERDGENLVAGRNYLALTGLPPDLDEWATLVPSQLCMNVKSWKPCGTKPWP